MALDSVNYQRSSGTAGPGGDNGHQQRALALEVVAKVVHLRHATWLTRISPLLVSVVHEYRRLYGHTHAGLQSLTAFTQVQSEELRAEEEDRLKAGQRQEELEAAASMEDLAAQSAPYGPDDDVPEFADMTMSGDNMGQGAMVADAEADYMDPGDVAAVAPKQPYVIQPTGKRAADFLKEAADKDKGDKRKGAKSKESADAAEKAAAAKAKSKQDAADRVAAKAAEREAKKAAADAAAADKRDRAKDKHGDGGEVRHKSASRVRVGSSAREPEGGEKTEGDEGRDGGDAPPKPAKVKYSSKPRVSNGGEKAEGGPGRLSTDPSEAAMSVATSQQTDEAERFVGWPSLEVARVFRVAYGVQMTRLFKAYVGSRPFPMKVHSFDDLEKLKGLLSMPEFLKLLTDLQFVPQWFNKTDVSYIFTTATAGIPCPLEGKAQLVAYEEFLKLLWYASRELQKKEYAPWLEDVDDFDDQPACAHAFIEFLHQRCVENGAPELVTLWRRTKPKPPPTHIPLNRRVDADGGAPAVSDPAAAAAAAAGAAAVATSGAAGEKPKKKKKKVKKPVEPSVNPADVLPAANVTAEPRRKKATREKKPAEPAGPVQTAAEYYLRSRDLPAGSEAQLIALEVLDGLTRTAVDVELLPAPPAPPVPEAADDDGYDDGAAGEYEAEDPVVEGAAAPPLPPPQSAVEEESEYETDDEVDEDPDKVPHFGAEVKLVDAQGQPLTGFALKKAQAQIAKQEEVKRRLAEEKAMAAKMDAELKARLAAQRLAKQAKDKEKADAAAKALAEEKAKQDAEAELKRKAAEEKRLAIAEFRLKKEAEEKLSEEERKAKAEREAEEKKKKLEEWRQAKGLPPLEAAKPLRQKTVTDDAAAAKPAPPPKAERVPIPPAAPKPAKRDTAAAAKDSKVDAKAAGKAKGGIKPGAKNGAVKLDPKVTESMDDAQLQQVKADAQKKMEEATQAAAAAMAKMAALNANHDALLAPLSPGVDLNTSTFSDAASPRKAVSPRADDKPASPRT